MKRLRRSRAEAPIGSVRHAAQRQRDQQRDDDRVENHGRQDSAFGRIEVHDVQSLQRRDGGDEQRRDDGEILGHVVGDREGGQRTARHQELLADLDDLDQFRGVIVQVDHVAGLLGGLRTAVHRHAHVGLRQRRGIVRAVAHHGDQFTGPLLAADVFEFILGAGFGDEVVDACLFGNVFCRQRVVARHHHGFHAHLAQTLETLADTRLDDVLQFVPPP